MPFSASANTGERFFNKYLTRKVGLTRRVAEQLVSYWIDNDVIVIDTADKRTKLKGYRLIKYPEPPKTEGAAAWNLKD